MYSRGLRELGQGRWIFSPFVPQLWFLLELGPWSPVCPVSPVTPMFPVSLGPEWHRDLSSVLGDSSMRDLPADPRVLPTILVCTGDILPAATRTPFLQNSLNFGIQALTPFSFVLQLITERKRKWPIARESRIFLPLSRQTAR